MVPHHRFKSSVIVLALIAAVFAGASTAALAQPTLNINRIINNWPIIEIYFTVGCQGQPAYDMKPKDFIIRENGKEIDDFTLWCPDPHTKCAISVSLVFDCSGSMNNGGLVAAQQAGESFVSNMDGTLDEACVIAFSDSVTMVQTMTTSKFLLNQAIGDLQLGNMTRCWDGCYEGLQEVMRAGTNPCRAVILLTDGLDTYSVHTRAEITTLATRNRIRVFTIALGGMAGAGELQLLAESTGGRFYASPTPAQLEEIYGEISTVLREGFQECMITYETSCTDGGKRIVDVILNDFCGGLDQKTKFYWAPKDSSTYTDLNISLGKGGIKGAREIKIPLNLDTPVNNENLYPAEFVVNIMNPYCGLRFVKIETPPGSILEGVPITVTPSANAVKIRTTQRKLINGRGVMAVLTFMTADTLCCSDISISNWAFEQGCFRPVLSSGEICSIPMQPVVQCRMTSPTELMWNRNENDYVPSPFSVIMKVTNTGDKSATNARFKIVYNAADFSLAGPTSDIQYGMPRDVAINGGSSEARWDLRARRRSSGKTVDVTIIASFDNHPDVTCSAQIFVPATEPILSCSISAPVIVPDNVNQKYEPMPFDLTVSVDNIGGSKTDSVFAIVTIPPDLSLAGHDAPTHFRKFVSSSISAGGKASATWSLKHPITVSPIDYTVRVSVSTENAGTSICEYKVTIPPLVAPVLRARCRVPDSLHFDEATGFYVPNPFDVALSCSNIGGVQAENVTGRIELPSNVVLEDTTDSLRRSFNPMVLKPWKPGYPESEIRWRVRYTGIPRYDKQLAFRFVTGGVSQLGVPADSAESTCEVSVRGISPSFDCTAILPDSCILNEKGSDVTPNPFTLTYKVWNTGKTPAKIATVTVHWPAGMGVNLEPLSQPLIKTVNKLLDPGDTLTEKWTFRIQNRNTRREVQFSIMTADEYGDAVKVCTGNLPIASLRTALMCDEVNCSEPVLMYRQVTQEYVPSHFLVNASFTNIGGLSIHNAWTKIQKYDPFDLIEFDSTVGGPGSGYNDTLQTIGYMDPGKTKKVTWAFRLKRPNRTGVSQFVEFKVPFKSDETPELSSCECIVEIKPIVTPILTCSVEAPDTIRFDIDSYKPSPFDVFVHVENLGSGDAFNTRAFVLQNTRFSLASVSSIDLDTLLAGDRIDIYGNPGFRLTVNPRVDDGFDTVRVTVAADGIPSHTCEYPVYVLHEKKPKFKLACRAVPDQLTFSDRLNDYSPNPFSVVTDVVNIGEVRAVDCKLSFIGPPRFTLEKEAPIEKIGMMETNGSFSCTWKVRAMCRQTNGWDTLYFQIQGRGGLNNRLVVDTCRALIYIPACLAPEYGMGCEQHLEFMFDRTTGKYQPDWVLVSDTIRNIGLAQGIGLEATLLLPPGLYLESSESPSKQLPDLNPGESAVVGWLVSPISRQNDTSVTATVSLKDRSGTSTACSQTQIFIPHTTAFALMCETGTGEAFPDSLIVDRQLGTYAGGPFNATVWVVNSGQRPLDSVRILIIPESRDIIMNGESQILLALKLDPGISVPVRWRWNSVSRTDSGHVGFRFIVSAKPSVFSECDKSVFIPGIGRPRLDAVVSTSPDDTLHFNRKLGDFEGIKSPVGDYNVFTVAADVTNVGAAQGNSLIATILPPVGATLDEGDVPIKPIDPSSLIVNGHGVVSWRLRPVRQRDGALRTFGVQVTSLNAATITRSADVFIQGAPKLATLTIPQDNIGQFGEKIQIPIWIDPTVDKDLYSYRINVRYNPNIVRFDHATNANTLTAGDWTFPVVTEFSNNAPGDNSIVRVESSSMGVRLNSRESGILVYLVFEATYNKNEMDFSQSEMTMLNFTPDGSSTRLLTVLNSSADDVQSDIALTLEQGMVTVSGECVSPLNSTLKYRLDQNKPNPFNPTTLIGYEIPERTCVTIRVFDQLGREIRNFVFGSQEPGRHSVKFDAGSLPSGIYTYKIETPHFVKAHRMVLSR